MDAISSLLSSASLPFSGQGVGTETTSTAEDFLAAIEQAAVPGAESEAHAERIEEVATEFESIFLSLLLKEMRNTLDQQDGGLFGGEGSDTFGGMFDMFMGQHLADASPLGISDAVKSYLGNSPQS